MAQEQLELPLYEEADLEDCPRCHGEKRVRSWISDDLGENVWIDCPTCNPSEMDDDSFEE